MNANDSPSSSSRWPAAPNNSRQWRQDSGRVTISDLGEHVLAVEVAGFLSDEALDFCRMEVGAFMESSGAAHLFWDCSQLERFGSRIRDGMVGLLVSRRSEWQTAHVLVRSSLVSMTVSAVGLGLFGRLKSYREPKDFYRAVEQTLATG